MRFAGVDKAEMLAPDTSYAVFILASAAAIRVSQMEKKKHKLCILVSSVLSKVVSLG